ncbi:telomerase protein component 1 isoform X1 [Erpetoichthys calabaricus]|uniref:telomerase protein component 1 isoform X1 n=1 Tax=Erpetoichthys calabaricus TaxID=27687 RepID=UPI002234B6BB|nr:telomerase protein component 1 isoform X1 [Erpetoichthys calabaricus]XP_051779108.1 telomerase protein component 1 isoform X1 [Erpetoichthys calabaricus]XP_051779109.1 telomerase protein component 1 isoform X1 [Erpetoichthys calabaricus]XP_051779110.1 telomerase protein component 1 isoform X1 [Erpetoichthys calabaricus]
MESATATPQQNPHLHQKSSSRFSLQNPQLSAMESLSKEPNKQLHNLLLTQQHGRHNGLKSEALSKLAKTSLLLDSSMPSSKIHCSETTVLSQKDLTLNLSQGSALKLSTLFKPSPLTSVKLTGFPERLESQFLPQNNISQKPETWVNEPPMSDDSMVSEEKMDEDKELKDSTNIGECEEMPIYDLWDIPETDETEPLVKLLDRIEQSDEIEEKLKENKILFLNLVCCSLIKLERPPKEDWEKYTCIWSDLNKLATEIADKDPEFILKTAVYTRQELNIRLTANFLSAIAAKLPSTRPHVRRYFKAAVHLPSDWLEVARLYNTCFGSCMPSCLKKALTEKFKEFNEFQLAKYNTRKQRCKHKGTHKSTKQKDEEAQQSQITKWAKLLKIRDFEFLKYKRSCNRAPADKQQDVFNLKNMIQKLHIKKPAELVMSVLGRRYPSDMRSYFRSGLSGPWDSQRAGKRMKLSQPETWERKLCLLGNKTEVWEDLIDKNQLGFMAMLRNLRNIIMKNVSETHHKKIIHRLSDKKSVIHSRQFPFRFLSAYKVIVDLEKQQKEAAEQPLQSRSEMLAKILSQVHKSFKSEVSISGWTSKRRRALRVPLIYKQLKLRETYQRKTRNLRLNMDLLQKYKNALEMAINISCQHNIPPLSGRSLIFIRCDSELNMQCRGAESFCISSDSDKGPVKVKEVALLLGLMMASVSENAKLYFFEDDKYQEAKLQHGTVLENLEPLMQQCEAFPESQEKLSVSNFFFDLTAQGIKVDTLMIMWPKFPFEDLEYPVHQYRRQVNPNTLVINLGFNDRFETSKSVDKNWVELYGFTEQILKFMAERGSSRFLEHIENISETYNIPPKEDNASKLTGIIDQSFIPLVPKVSWRSIRVFISSTFRDMHGERDLLIRYVFPELRQRAAHHYIHLQEVDLRWGITEEEARSNRTVELCLSEVAKSQLFVGILGERYGLVPTDISLPDLPHFQWVKTAPPGLSVTELEIMQFQKQNGSFANQKMFFYLRTPELIRSVPEQWRSDFVAESTEARGKMEDLKKRLKQSGTMITENYEAEWGGVSHGKPYTKGLEQFGKAVLSNLWEALKQFFHVEQDDEILDSCSKLTDQEVFKESLQHQIYGRKKVLGTAATKIREMGRGKCFVINSGPGQGKTALMAAMVNEFKTSSKKTEIADVICYFSAASQAANNVENFLHFLVRCLNQRLGQDLDPPTGYQALLKEFNSLLQSSCRSKSNPFLVILIDDADLLQNNRGQLISDWIPESLPSRVTLVLSVTSDSDLHRSLNRNKNSILFQLESLSTLEKKEIVQSVLSLYGKKLSETSFNNQMQVLLRKKGSNSPLYLKLACEYLRTYSVFEQMKDELQNLPSTLDKLILRALSHLEEDSKVKNLSWVFAVLAVTKTGLRERDLYDLLSMCNMLRTNRALSWNDVMNSGRINGNIIPMAMFAHLMRALQSVIGQHHTEHSDSPLLLKNSIIQVALEQHYLKKLSLEKTAHLLVAAHLWKLSDPDRNGTFKHCDASALTELPIHLVYSGELHHLHSLLSNVNFIYAHVRLGLLPELLEAYNLYDSVISREDPGLSSQSSLEPFKNFLHQNHSILSREPCLFLQQAINEPNSTAVFHWAQGVLENKVPGFHVMEWLNKPQQARKNISKTVHFTSIPACVAVSPSGRVAVVGTNQGLIHVFTTDTSQEIRSIASAFDGISTCIFLDEATLCSTSFNGQIELWNIVSGYRVTHIEGHRNQITSCDISPDKKHFVTVSLDMDLKVWNGSKGSLAASLSNPSPLNCVSFHPNGQLIALGRWDRSIGIWDWLSRETFTTLVGHGSSVRTLAFAPSGDFLVSGDMDGEIRFWSVPSAVCVTSFSAHSGSAEVVQFLDSGRLLMTAGADRMVRLWSGSPGQNVGKLPSSDCSALSVDISNDYIAVGFHSSGIRIHYIRSGELLWESKEPKVSVWCVIWLEQERLLLSGSNDCILRVWNLESRPNMVCKDILKEHHGPIYALAKSDTLVAAASDDFSVTLWSVEHLKSNSSGKKPVAVLKGHSAGVTCLSFSPSGSELVTGSKDLSLIFWDVKSSSPTILRSFKRCHADWITGCAWNSQALITSSNDCRLCVWDPLSGKCLNEFLGHSAAVSSVSLLNEYVVSSGGDGKVRVWKVTGAEIAHISAHVARINECIFATSRWKKSTEPTGESENQELKPEDIWLATASDDGTVKFWQPLMVQHMNSLEGHSGSVLAAAQRKENFFTVSDDQSLRIWQLPNEPIPPAVHHGSVKLCAISPCGEIVLSGSSSGELCVWYHNSLAQKLQMSKYPVNAALFKSESEFILACSDNIVCGWRINRSTPESSISLKLISSTRVSSPVTCLAQGPKLLGGCANGTLISIPFHENFTTDWESEHHIIGFLPKTKKNITIAAEVEGMLDIKLIDFENLTLQVSKKDKEVLNLEGNSWITCVASFENSLTCGDSEGYLWYRGNSKDSKWNKMKVHKNKVSALKMTESVIITASYDQSIKLWDCKTMKQVGLFLCKGPVTCLELNPSHDRFLVCGDILGNVYFIEWTE